jgi:hypothetical protein
VGLDNLTFMETIFSLELLLCLIIALVIVFVIKILVLNYHLYRYIKYLKFIEENLDNDVFLQSEIIRLKKNQTELKK